MIVMQALGSGTERTFTPMLDDREGVQLFISSRASRQNHRLSQIWLAECEIQLSTASARRAVKD